MPPCETPSAPPRRLRRCLIGTAWAAGLAAAVVGAFAAATFTPDAAPTGWVSRPVLTSNDLRSGQEVIFRADYKAGLWTGRVSADYIDALGELQGDSPWTGGNTMNILESTDWNADRRIVTRTSAGVAVPFRWAYMDAAQRTALVRQELLNFVRGDRSNESPNGQRYRVRDKIQGDIQHSSLVFWRHAGGATRLYVGGNDGMLHAFDAATGRESFAYVPSMLIPRLSRLTASPYVHSLYVDGGLSAANVQLTSGWRTLLAGALGGGGKGLFMLDVTNPSPANETEAAALVKWEVTPASTGFANLGYTYAKPRLARLNDGSAAVVVGNGYLNSGSGHATLFLINADTGALIREIDTGSGSSASPNGLSTPTLLDADQDGKVDYAYAGDLDGNLWKFDLRGASAAGYSASKLMTTSPQQAITSAPAVARGPKGGQMVVFGTGRILNSADAADTAAHYVYGVWDGAPAQNTAWLEQTLTEVPYGSQRLRQVTAHQPDWTAGGDRGWRLALTAGERVVGEGQFISDSRFYFTTSNPTVPAAAGGTATGANWVMEVDYTTGGSPPLPIFDINEDKVIDEHDNIGGAVIVGMYLGQGVSSQSVLVDLSTFSLTLFNRQSDIDYSVPTAADGPGVSGGHFDVDFYFLSGTKFAGVKHVHEYDDKYDVTGVNMLNASDPTLNLGSKLAATVDFKVLLINQYLNPAVTLSVGGGDFVSVKTFGGQATTTDAATLLANQTAYRLSNVNTLVWNLPVDAFASKDWWGDGSAPRTGLIPTTTGCVNKVNSDGSTPTLGPNGERHDGAMTFQLVKAGTPASALELNYPAGGPKYGWRVKQSEFVNWVLAEYTTFWHHPNGKCYGASGWVQNAPQDFSGGSSSSLGVAGSQDPRNGSFGGAPVGVTVTSTRTSIVGNVTTITVEYSDGKTETTEITSNNDGTETVTATGRDGQVTTGTRMSSGSLGNASNEILQSSRRINWREVVRP